MSKLYDRKLRLCLACDTLFQSWCTANRICAYCKDEQRISVPQGYYVVDDTGSEGAENE